MMNIIPTNPAKFSHSEIVVPTAQSHAKQIHSEGLPFSPTIASGSANASIPKPSSTTLKSQEDSSKNTQKMATDLVNHTHGTHVELDRDFICGDQIYLESNEMIEDLQNRLEDFDVSVYIRGEKGQKLNPDHIIGHNKHLLDYSVGELRKKAQSLVAQGEAKDLKTAYKKLVGVLDKYDDHAIKQRKESSTSPKSTYALRTALLKASHADGVGLDTWCVYTKSGKPTPSGIWSFLEKGKNWIPEAQSARAKWIESTIIKTTALSQHHKVNQVVLLKGGFGAGKTRLINELFGEYRNGAIAPDKAKEIDRRANPDLPHAAAHIHGSQAAFELMNEMTQKQAGTVVYDSSLSNPKDVSNYLEQCKSAGKKMVIYDVARNDMARVLSVLKRPVAGEDPRIPPDFIIRSAINDKVNRVACMEVVLNDQTKVEQDELGQLVDHRPEYHFIGGDARGWNTKEVMVLGPEGKMDLQPEAEERLALEGIEVHASEKTLKLTVNRENLTKFFNEQFERPVKDIMEELSPEEQNTLSVFKERTFPLPKGEAIDHPSKLYDALPENIQAAIPKKAFENAFMSIGAEARKNFFASIRSKEEFNYEDLPLRVALTIHQNLKTDPWIN